MRYYELLYIVNPNLEDDRVNGIIEEIGNEVKKYKVNIINHHIWGKKRLSYPVKNNKYGIYILLQFGAEQFDFLKELERYLILSKTVIRHQVIKLDNEPKKVEKIEIDDEDSNIGKEDKLEDAITDIPIVADDVVNKAEKDENIETDVADVEVEESAEIEKDEPSSEEEKQEEGKE